MRNLELLSFVLHNLRVIRSHPFLLDNEDILSFALYVIVQFIRDLFYVRERHFILCPQAKSYGIFGAQSIERHPVLVEARLLLGSFSLGPRSFVRVGSVPLGPQHFLELHPTLHVVFVDLLGLLVRISEIRR